MKIIITMAGEGSRFKQQGYTAPKFQIESHGYSLFEWSMSSLANFFSAEFIFIVQAGFKAHDFIQDKCQQIGINQHTIIEIASLTDGQATTVLAASEHLSPDDQILIYNIDTFVRPQSLPASALKGDGWIPSFRAPGTHWSFVKTLEDNTTVIDIAEKKRISDFATIGLYYFSNFKLYLEAYNTVFQDSVQLVKGEKYIAPIYQYLIQGSFTVTTSVISSDAVYILGTPEELICFNNQAVDFPRL